MLDAPVSRVRVFDGFVETFKHNSTSTNCEMTFSVFLPDANDAVKVIKKYD